MNGQYQAVDSEALWAALFVYLQTTLGGTFTSIGRRLIEPPQLVTAQQPALFQIQLSQKHTPMPRGFPTKLQLSGLLVIYAPVGAGLDNIGEETLLCETVLNGLLVAIDAALLPDNLATGKFTLGGLVEHCWIEGVTTVDPGILSNQGKAMVPIHILAP
jgi:hypothetical protein